MTTLAEDLEEARETILQLRDMLAPCMSWLFFPDEWSLTAAEAKILASLMAKAPAPVSREVLHYLVVDPEKDGASQDTKMIDVMIMNLRRKLAGFGFEVLTNRGVGYEISKHDADTLKLIVEAEQCGDKVTDFVRVARVGDFEFGPYLDCSGSITSPEHLEWVIQELRNAAARAWPANERNVA